MFDSVALIETGRKLAGDDALVCTDDELFEAAVGLGHLVSLVQVAQAHVLAELDARGATDVRFGMRTVQWVASQSGAAPGPIRGRLRVGRALRSHFDTVDEAVSSGDVSFDHAKTLADAATSRSVDALAAAQHEIVALADGAGYERWKADVAALAAAADPDGREPDIEVNTLGMPVTIDHTVHLKGTLDGANGLMLRTAINAKADELFRRFTCDHEASPDLPVPGRATLRALALVELIRTATGAELGSGSAPRAEVTLIAHHHEVTDTEGRPLPQAAIDVWGCDPEVWAVVVDHLGIPVDVGHSARIATVAQRRAIAIRDGGCTFPGCDAPIAWCDLHHVTWWHHGGPTDLANLVALCRHHHGVTHRNGWSMRLSDDQIPIWTSPSGQTLYGQRQHRRQPPQPPPGPLDDRA